jgi:hypothetical protein
MGGEPIAAFGDELVDLVVAHPIVLILVEHRYQDIELIESIGEAKGPRQFNRNEARGSRGSRNTFDAGGLAQRFEEFGDDFVGAANGQGRDADLERNRCRSEFRPLARIARHRGSEHSIQRDGQERRGGVGVA